jgi:C1A family cysteine protease
MFYYHTLIVLGRNKKKARKKKKIKEERVIDPMTTKFQLGYRRDPVDKRDYNFQTLLVESPITMAAKIDYTAEMSSVKDQGQLGSCVGFAVSAMKEWQEKREHEEELAKGKRGEKKIYDYSESWVYWNSKKIDPWPGEQGTSIRYAMKVLQKIGVPTEKAWPYKDMWDIGEPKSWSSLVARWALIGSYWRINNLTELKSALNTSPMPIGVACFLEIFYTGADGIVAYPKDPNNIYGGHAICAVGYNDATKLVKFKNSWGEGWGQNGYGYLPYSYINDFMWDAWTCKDVAVTKDMLKGARELV